MKREDLEKLGLAKEMIDGVMKLHNAYVDTHKAELTAKDTKITDLQGKVKDANKTINDLQDSVSKFDGSVSKEELDKQIQGIKDGYEKQLASKDQDFAIDKLFQGQKFSSNLAKEAAMKSFKEKELKFENGNFLGSDDFFKNLKESDPTAFASDEPQKKDVNLGGDHGDDGVDSDTALRMAMGLPVENKK